MAARAATKKTTAKPQPKRATARSASRETIEEEQEDSLSQVIFLLLVFAVSVLLMVAVLGFGGAFGVGSRVVLFGMFGVFAFLFPIALFAGVLFAVSNRGNGIATAKLIAGICTYLLVAVLLELFRHGEKTVGGIEAFQIGQMTHAGGGFFGGFLAGFLVRLFGVVGAYVLAFAGLAICLVLLTENVPFARLKEDTAARRRRSRQRRAEREQQEELERERRALERQKLERDRRRMRRQTQRQNDNEEGEADERHQGYEESGEKRQRVSDEAEGKRTRSRNGRFSGISADTTILPEHTPGSDEISEITFAEEDVEENSGAENADSLRSESGQTETAEQIVSTEETTQAESGNVNDRVAEVSFAESKILPERDEVEEKRPRLSITNDPDEPLGSYFKEAETAETESTFEPEADAGADEFGGAEPLPFASIESTEAESVAVEGISDEMPTVETRFNTERATDEMSELTESGFGAEAEQRNSTVRNEAESTVETVKSAVQEPQSKAETKPSATAKIQSESKETNRSEYEFPPIDLLSPPKKQAGGNGKASLQETADKLQQILANFGVKVTVTNAVCGPTVTRYELQPEMGVKVSKIVNLADDIKLNLAAEDIRIEAPIPGKAAVGIEVPNKEAAVVSFRELIEDEAFQKEKSPIAFAAGRDIGGNIMIANIAKMPHVLIAGATGAGKSVCINTIIMSILYKAHPDDVKFIMIDPKVVELSVYNGIPHLLQPVVTDPKKAAGALHWAVHEMMDRYDKFAKVGVRNMEGYNSKIIDGVMTFEDDGEMVEVATKKMPQIVVIVDELADLMMVASKEVEESICRLAQLARAAGIHLVIATQRPSVNVITGLIKANMPSRIAFAVTSGVDSRTILDMVGAEKLLGKGDMLYYPQGYTKPVRAQGAFVSDKEVAEVVDFIKKQNGKATYDEAISFDVADSAAGADDGATQIGSGGRDDSRDQYYDEAARLLIDKEKGSIGMLQRYFKIGFNRAARIMDQLEEGGVVGPEVGTKPRSVLMTLEEYEQSEGLETGSVE